MNTPTKCVNISGIELTLWDFTYTHNTVNDITALAHFFMNELEHKDIKGVIFWSDTGPGLHDFIYDIQELCDVIIETGDTEIRISSDRFTEDCPLFIRGIKFSQIKLRPNRNAKARGILLSQQIIDDMLTRVYRDKNMTISAGDIKCLSI